MITILSPNELPHGINLRMWQVDSEAEAMQITGTLKSYLYRSKIINQMYLFVVVTA